MKASEFTTEDNFGTHPKRAARTGSRHPRGHEPVPRYKTVKDQDVEEGWKDVVAGGAMALGALGAGHAQAADLSSFNTQYLQQVASGEHPRPMVSIDDAKAELQARANGKQQSVPAPAKSEEPKGFSKEYLQKAADPNRFGRYLISVEKAQELLSKVQESVSEGADEYVFTVVINGKRATKHSNIDDAKDDARIAKTKGAQVAIWKEVCNQERVAEAGSPAQQAAIAIAKQESGKYSEKDGHRLKEDSDKAAAVRRLQHMLNNKFDANLDVDGVLGPLTLKTINQFMPKALPGKASEPDRNTRVQGNQIKEAGEDKCPPATQDISLNLKNRQKAINEYGYGPLNPDMPNTKFWMKKVAEWNLDSAEEAKQSLCGNCAAFDQRQDTLACIAQGIGSDAGEQDPTIEAGDLGYCRFLKFKCAARRTCDAWVTGGPLVDKQPVDENLHDWFGKEKWVRFGPDGKIRGDCARGSESEGKPKCLPRSKAQALGKKGRAASASKKRREDPNPERRGAAHNVATRVKEDDAVEDRLNEKWSQKYKSSINCSHPKGFSQRAHCAGKKKHNESIEMEMTCPDCGMCQTHGDHSRDNLEEACWKGYHKEGNKKMFGKTYPNCVKNEGVAEEQHSCPHCGGEMVSEELMNEKKDACYYKVKSRYKVWPSAYASGALVKCRKKGADNWGNKNESMENLMSELDRIVELSSGVSAADRAELHEEFDLIESIIDSIAEQHGVEADVVWEDLESLTEDELYVFAVTSQPIMESEAWQKANNRDKTDGMSRKAVNTYRREHPGSKLQTAVTTKPSKLKKGSKSSKRRKSYCSRSRGQMKMHNISCAKTPDKAICKARRRWNC